MLDLESERWLSELRPHDRVGIKFNDKEAYGRFCMALTEHEVPFIQLGLLSVGVSVKDFDGLKDHLSPLQYGELNQLHDQRAVTLYNPTVRGKNRYVPTIDEAESALRQLVSKRLFR